MGRRRSPDRLQVAKIKRRPFLYKIFSHLYAGGRWGTTMDSIVGRFRKLFTNKKQRLPAFIEVDVDLTKYWNILEDIGEGSFGSVKKVSRKDDPRQIAAFKCTEIQEDEEVEDLAIEVEILLACKHENVVGIIAAYYYENCLSVMLEYCAGGAVDQIMLELDKGLTENQTATVIRQVTNGLVFLHSKYVIHRDLKAGNILLTADGTAKIADFGVSTMLNGPDEGSNTFIGTPHWMSPEIVRCETMPNLLYNTKADIWALGITCIQLAEKEPPYHELSAERVRLKILRSSKPPTLERPAAFSPMFRDFINQCCMINAEDRCTAADLMTHPFISKATDKKPIVVLLLEMSADFLEEPVFENSSGSCAASVCSSDGTSLWSRPESSSLNTSGENEKQTSFDHEATPVPDLMQSKKKRAAPAPPPQEVVSKPPTAAPQRPQEPSEPEEVAPRPVQSFVSQPTTPSKQPDDNAIMGHLSPSGAEAMQILDDLDIALDKNDHRSINGSRSSSLGSTTSGQRNQDRTARARLESAAPHHSSTDSVSQVRQRFEAQFAEVRNTENGSTIVECGTIPTHTIRDAARYSRPTSVASSQSRKSSVSSNRSTARENVTNQGHQPVLLRVNADDDSDHQSSRVASIRERIVSGSSEGSHGRNSVAADIPQGLVAKHREIAQKEQLAVHARDEAQRIKEQRRIDDAALFGDQQTPVSDLAATFTTKLSATSSLDSSHSNRNNSRQEVLRKSEQLEHRSLSVASAESQSSGRPEIVQPERSTYQPYNYFVEEATRNSTSTRTSVEEAPPPEPPVDYDETPKAPNQPLRLNDAEAPTTPRAVKTRRQGDKVNGKENNDPKPSKENLVRRTPSRQTATKKTRTFTVDGIQMTSTTMHVLDAKQNHEFRREQEREYLRMQREEARQRTLHEKKSAALQENQERSFMHEKMNMEKSFQSDIDLIAKTQKKKIEDLERAQEEELRQLAKRLKVDQERQIRIFRDQLNREQKLLKQEADLLPKPQRKEVYKLRKEQLDKIHSDRELQFLDKLDQDHEICLEQLRSAHREKMAMTERQCLEHKHQIESSSMSALWELEERQLTERYNLNQLQLKELYLLQRSQMIGRHQKEQECIRNTIKEEEARLNQDLNNSRKELPKTLRAQSKIRYKMFKESLSIDYSDRPEMWDRLLAEFDAKEKERVKNTIAEYEKKCRRRLDNLVAQNQQFLKDLEQIHAEKRSMLCENEQQMLAECEEQFQQLLNENRASRPARKTELERRFAEESERQLKFYNIIGPQSA
uniref:Protein kinase domain-containing protein n=1 Tax=Panagrellus redivivus TaxID=6233 RepID=A0A7E4VX49_PANRE